MTILEEKFNESTFEQENGQFVLECGSLWMDDYGCVSESKPQESESTLNQVDWHEIPVVHLVSQTGFDESPYGGCEIIKSYLSSYGFICFDEKPSYFAFPISISSSGEMLSYVTSVLEKPRNFEIIIKSESLPPDN